MATWGEVSFSYQFWFLIAFGLASLQLMTDEFFFGGACVGALLTGIILLSVGAEAAAARINLSLPYILCGAGGLLGATVMRWAARKQLSEPDINEEPYDGEGR